MEKITTSWSWDELSAEIERLRTILQKIADDDVDDEFKGRADILSDIARAALNPK